jgi:fructuronate reductase
VTVAHGLLGVRDVFGDDLPDQAVFRNLLVEHLKELL